MNTNFAGLNGFVWWIGEVRNVDDPLRMGRVKVRIFGWHTSDPNDATATIPDNDLPWAHPVLPISGPAGQGTNLWFDKVKNKGEWVVGFFADSESGQFPLVFGRIPGYVEKL